MMNKLDELSALYVMDYKLGNEFETDFDYHAWAIQESIEQYYEDTYEFSFEEYMEKHNWAVESAHKLRWLEKRTDGEEGYWTAHEIGGWDPEINVNWGPSWDDSQLQSVIKKMITDGYRLMMNMDSLGCFCMFRDSRMSGDDPPMLGFGSHQSKDFNEAVLVAALKAKGVSDDQFKE